MKVKKIISLFLSAVMAVTAAATLAVGASAAGIADTSTEIESGKSYTETIKASSNKDYKFNVSSAGTLKVTLYSYFPKIFMLLYDESGTAVWADSGEASVGKCSTTWSDRSCSIFWSDAMENGKATFKFSVSKGTYYLRIHTNTTGGGKYAFKATFPSAEKESKTTFTSFVLPMKVGDALTLGTDLSDTAQTITWKSSKTSVATVTKKGKITAKAAGTATITATVGSTSIKIIIKVTK